MRRHIARLSNLEELRSATAAANLALSADSSDPFGADASSLIDTALRQLDRVSASDAQLSSLADTLRSLSAQVNDAARELAVYASDLDQEGPGELARANERLALLHGLLRKFGTDAAGVIAHSRAGIERLTELEGDDERIDQLQERARELGAREQELAQALSAARHAAGSTLSELVSKELRELALPDARFIVEIIPAEPSRTGADEVQLLLQPHPGAAPRPLAKGASGGELSRVMLALEVVVAAVDPVPGLGRCGAHTSPSVSRRSRSPTLNAVIAMDAANAPMIRPTICQGSGLGQPSSENSDCWRS